MRKAACGVGAMTEKTILEGTHRPAAARSWRGYARFVPALVIAVGLAAAYAGGIADYLSLGFLAHSRDALLAYVAGQPLIAGAGFFALYVIAVALSIPAASVLTIFGGFLFGWAAGGFIALAAATLGATLVFLAARSAVRDSLRERIGGRADRMAKGFEKGAFGYLLALRLAPVFPFFVVNIAPALFHVRLKTYFAATALGILPGTFAYAYIGDTIETVLGAAEAAGRAPRFGDLASPELLLGLSLMALAIAVPTAVGSLMRHRGD